MRRPRSNHLVTLVVATAAMLAIMTLPASAAGPAGGACQLTGLANLSPGLGVSSQSFSYSFTGSLSGCQSNIDGAPTSGTVSAGISLPETVTLTNLVDGTTTTGTVQYQEPVPTGSGSCGSSTTAGKALTSWADGTKTVIDYATSGALAGVSLTGTVVPSLTLSLVPSSVPAGYSAPATFTIGTTRFTTVDSAAAALTFSPTTQDQDCASKPVSAANINGVVGVGTPS